MCMLFLPKNKIVFMSVLLNALLFYGQLLDVFWVHYDDSKLVDIYLVFSVDLVIVTNNLLHALASQLISYQCHCVYYPE